MTPEQTLDARAAVVSEILAERHSGHKHLQMAINCARNAALAGHSAHRALQRGEEWISHAHDVDDSGQLRTTLAQAITAIPDTHARNVYPTATGYQADLIDYHTGCRGVIRIDAVYGEEA